MVQKYNISFKNPECLYSFQASVSYHKRSTQSEDRKNAAHSAASAALAAAQWSHHGQKSNEEQLISLKPPYSEKDIERLAEYSVRMLVYRF